MFKIIIYLIGVFFTSLGIFFTIIYLNLLTLGYSFGDFVKFISRKLEFWFILIGIILIIISLERLIKNELLLRYNLKLERRSRI